MNLIKTLNRIPAKLYNAETISYRDRIIANGGTISEGSLDAVEKFVRDCRAANIWDKFTEIGTFAGNNLNAALVKLLYSTQSTLTNLNFVSGDYTETGASAGLNGDGSTKYLNTGFNAQNLASNGHYSFYLRDDPGVSGNRAMMGAITASDQYWIGSLNAAADIAYRYGQLANASSAQALTKGFYTGTRIASNNNRLIKNGVLLNADGTAVTHTKPNQSVFLWAYSTAGGPSAFLPGRACFYSIGASLTDSEALALHNAVRTLQINLNRSIN